jgi:hypothetical protein
MSETRDLIGIYGAIGKAAAKRPEQVQQFVPAFSPENADWIDALSKWADEKRTDRSEPAFPDLDQALANLAEREARGYRRARRLFALGAAVQAFPDVGRARTSRGQLAIEALRSAGLVDDADGGADLLKAIARKPRVRPGGMRVENPLDEWWANVTGVGGGPARLAPIAPADLGPRPCAGSLKKVTVRGVDRYAAAITAGFTDPNLPFERAIEFLAPVNWPKCHDFWCEMQELGVRPSGARHYREVVSTNCANRAAGWTVTAELDFTFYKTDDEAVTNYDLAEGRPVEGDEVVVDAGSLIVNRAGAGVDVVATKRILFDREEPSAAVMATVLCLVGYGTAVEDLVYSCAIDPGAVGTPFPADGAREFAPAGSAGNAVIDSVAGRATQILRTCIDRGSERAAASRVLMRQGKYGADALARDAVGLTVHILKESSEALRGGLHYSRPAATAERSRHREARGGR